jgi:hypothetical protein
MATSRFHKIEATMGASMKNPITPAAAIKPTDAIILASKNVNAIAITHCQDTCIRASPDMALPMRVPTEDPKPTML